MRGTVLSVVKNNLGIYGFIKAGEKNFYYNTSGVTKGLFMKKGIVVDFDVVKLAVGRDKAINIRASLDQGGKAKSMLTDSQINEISLSLTETISDNGFVAAASIPFILKKIGINNFREYADSIEDFINIYFGREYQYIKNFVKDQKNYPGVVAKIDREQQQLMQFDPTNSQKELAGEILKTISEKIHKICDEDGFVLSSTFPVILRNIGVNNYKQYAESVEHFLNIFFPKEFTVLKDVLILGKRYPGIIIPVEQRDDFQENQVKNDVLVEEQMTLVDNRIEETIKSNGFLLLSVVPSVLNEFGIEYRDYAINLIDFIQNYFEDKYIVKENYQKNGKILPNVLVMSDAEKDINEQPIYSDIKSADYCLLDALYSEKKYIEYLRALHLTGDSFDKIPAIYIDKAFSCANQLLNLSATDFSLNLFQKELLYSRTGRDFIKKWKKPNGYPNTILANFEKSSVCCVSAMEDIGTITKLINNACSDTKINNSFASLTSRFEACVDSLTFLLYMIRAFSPVSPKKVEKTVGEYCAFLKTMKADNISQRINFSELLDIFEKYINIIVNYIISEPISRGTCTNIISVYLDLNYQERIPTVLTMICKDNDDSLMVISEFLSKYELWDTEQYAMLFGKGINLRIIEKICAFIWEKTQDHFQLNETILKMLAQVLLYGGQNVLDEIIRLHISQEYTKKQKEFALLNAFHSIIERLYTDDSWFILAAYIKANIYDNSNLDNDNNIDSISVNEIRNWKAISDYYFTKKLEQIGELSESNEADYLKLFQLFIDEREKTQLLQKKYNDWYGDLHDWYANTDQKQIERYLDDVYSKGVDYAFSFIYECAEENEIHISDEYAMKYVESLLRMNMYDKVIRFVKLSENFTNDEKEEIIVQTVCDNFIKYGLMEEAFLIFTENFSISDAIVCLEKNIFPNKFAQILALIILHAKNDALIKSVYLYMVYHGHAETGYTRIYSQYRSKYGRFFGKLHDHYEVFLKAFEALPYKELLDFVSWCASIIIPGFAEYNPGRNTFSFFINEIIKNPEDMWTWKKFISHLYSHREIEANQWPLCVSSIMARHKFNVPNVEEVQHILVSTLNIENRNKWPESLLYYVAKYIVDNEDEMLCEKLYEALSSSNLANKMLYENPWCDMSKQLDFFADYCVEKLRETSDLVYFNLLTVIKEDLSGSELVEFSSFSVNKTFLLNKICKYYIQNRNQGEAIALLSNENIWKNLTFQESELLNAVKLLYMSADEIIEQDQKLFRHEEDVSRFKRDLAIVLEGYPSQEPLLDFDKSCTNDAHKLRIYSAIYGVYGNEELYKKYQFEFDVMMSKGIEYEYLAFLKKCLVAQLFYNATYEYFYKLWRYLRLQIISCWDEDNQQEDETIEDIMRRYQHYDMAMRLGYADFKDILHQFVADKSISKSNRKYILYCLLKEDFGLLCDNKDSIFSCISENAKSLIGKMTSFLDFRDINERLFKKFDEDICNGKLDKVYELTKNLSLSFSNLLDAISHSEDYTADVQLVKKYMNGSAAACVNSIISLDDEMYSRKEIIYISLLGARQLAFKIFDRIRASLIKRRIQFSTKRYEGLAKYLDKLGYGSARSQFYHILAMEYALKRDVDSLRLIVSMDGAFVGIPIEWEDENDKLVQYSYTEGNNKFEPVFSITYIGAGQSKKGKITFANEVCRLYKLDLVDKMDEELISELYHEYYGSGADIREKIISGLKILQSAGTQYFDNKRDDWPEYCKFAFDVGTLIASKESFVSSEIKIFVLVDLYWNGDLTGLQKQALYETFMSFYKELSLDQWIKNYDSIANIVMSSGDNDGAEEIVDLCESIKKSAPGLLDTGKYSLEELYDQLIKVNYIGQSIYSVAVARAVEKKKEQIESAVRLSVEIENEEVNGYRVVNDGYVYLCVKNIGCTSLNIFEESEIELYLNSNDGTQYTPLFAEVSGIKELRPNWLTGCRVDISKIIDTRKKGEFLNACVLIHVNGVLVCSQKGMIIISAPILFEEMPEPVRNGYYVNLAVGDNEDDHKLYGRSEEKEDIKYAISTGKAVIYGPSRIGKSSLLNWIIHSYAREKGNVISILVGGEEGNGKENDYDKNIKDKSKLFYDSNALITEYLFVETLINGINSINIINPKRRRAVFPDAIDQEHKDILLEIEEILVRHDRSIVDRYYDIDYILQSKGYEIWLLFDEFQQVVEKWNLVEVEEPSEFIEICNCINERSITNIKLVFCGSDELLRQMVLVRSNSVWRKKIFESATGVRIGHIKEVKKGQTDEFIKMLEEDSAVRRPGLKYSAAALKTLDIYSDRVPLYAKEICNTVLGEIKRISGIRQFGRNIIYSYDVSVATQNLMDIQNYALTHPLEESHKERIVKIYDAVTKGLEEDTDKQYLWVMAEWFMKNPSKVVFNFKEYLAKKGYKLIEGESGLRDRLDVACVRGIIRGNEEVGYMFSTPFYYSAFCGTVQNFIESNIFVTEDRSNSAIGNNLKESIPGFDQVIELIKGQIEVGQFDIGKIFESCKDEDFKAGFNDMYEKLCNIQTDSFVSDNRGTSTGRQNNVQINAQTINAAFNTLLDSTASSDALLQAFQTLPSLRAYIPDSHKSLVSGKATQLLADYKAYDECFSEDGQCIDADQCKNIEERIAKIEAELENLNMLAEKRMIGDTVGAVVASETFMDVNEQRWEQLLHISADKVAQLRSLPAEVSTPLAFAVILHNVFDEVYNGIINNKKIDDENALGIVPDKMDFCPVAIMYCKVVEYILKKLHTPLYIKGLGDKRLKLGGQAVFVDLGTADSFDENHRELSIDSYACHLVFLPKKKLSLDAPMRKPTTNDFKFGFMKFGEYEEDFDDNIRRLIDDNNIEDEKIGPWKVHARALKVINEIRNRSAHEAIPITKEIFDWLIEVLFEKGEFIRLWELSK